MGNRHTSNKLRKEFCWNMKISEILCGCFMTFHRFYSDRRRDIRHTISFPMFIFIVATFRPSPFHFIVSMAENRSQHRIRIMREWRPGDHRSRSSELSKPPPWGEAVTVVSGVLRFWCRFNIHNVRSKCLFLVPPPDVEIAFLQLISLDTCFQISSLFGSFKDLC